VGLCYKRESVLDDRDNFVPRLGLALDPTGKGSKKGGGKKQWMWMMAMNNWWIARCLIMLRRNVQF
jgi:hypothetical protein